MQLLAVVEEKTLAIVVGLGVGVLVMIYFGVRFWLARTPGKGGTGVPTPNLDRLNRRALEHLDEEEEEEDDDEPPEGLKAAVPDDEE